MRNYASPHTPPASASISNHFLSSLSPHTSHPNEIRFFLRCTTAKRESSIKYLLTVGKVDRKMSGTMSKLKLRSCWILSLFSKQQELQNRGLEVNKFGDEYIPHSGSNGCERQIVECRAKKVNKHNKDEKGERVCSSKKLKQLSNGNILRIFLVASPPLCLPLLKESNFARRHIDKSSGNDCRVEKWCLDARMNKTWAVKNDCSSSACLTALNVYFDFAFGRVIAVSVLPLRRDFRFSTIAVNVWDVY